MEKLIGTILITGRLKKILVEYKLFFTESSVIAIEIGKVPNPNAPVNLLQFISPITALVIGLYEGKEDIKIINIWTEVVKEVNSKHISIVSYSEELSDDLLKLKSVDILYDRIKSVEFKKATREGADPSKVQYSMVFNIGGLSSEVFMIPATSLTEVTDLIRKTPLGSKLKGQYV
ncbi:MAG: hypothetical protein BK997_03400 [Candidatus Micrarchaeum sp. ARMAN-1]|nr:MAG: hypothetical protein BK997_03400 [Candidatus Micrarchaeum sp. ARMAN-1]